MYNIANFTPYPPLRKHLGDAVCLVWGRVNGYQFMTLVQRTLATAEGLDYKIAGCIEK